MAFRFSFFPRDEQFFELFNKMADEIKAAADLLDRLFASDPPDVSTVDLIRDAEHRCDALTHDTIQRLHRTFVTPFDREDLYALASALDNVMDAIDHAAVLVRLYKIKTVLPGARELTRTVTGSVGPPPRRARSAGTEEAGAPACGRDQPARERGGPRLPECRASVSSRPRPIRS